MINHVSDLPAIDCFRTMVPDEDGRPKVEPSARGLGVRTSDVTLDGLGRVLPGGRGMSVALLSVWNLPAHRRPFELGRGSTGRKGIGHVFTTQDATFKSAGLTLRPDPKSPDRHGFVEPTEPSPLAKYEQSLAETRLSWRQYSP